MQTLHKRDIDISVIIPVYNLEKYITPMLDSLKAQDLGSYNVEYIFVLNNCTDNSADIIKQSGLDCQLLECDIQGCGPARNTGMDAASGKYIWFMDGDDWLLSTSAIKNVVAKADQDDLNILRIVFDSELYKSHYYSMVWQYLFKREYINEFRFPDYQPREDDRFMDEVLSKAGYNCITYLQLPHLEQPLYFYNYLREGSNMFRFITGEKI